MKIKTLTDVIVIKPEPKESKTESGIIIPDDSRKHSDFGEVMAVGPGRLFKETGVVAPMELKVGDRVVYAGGAVGIEIEHEGERCWVMRERDVMGVLQ